jgi:chromosome segregation ATPase
MRAKLALFDNKQVNPSGGDGKNNERKDIAEPLIRRRSLAEIRSPLTPMTPNAGRLSISTPEAQKNSLVTPEKKNIGSDSKKINPSPSSTGSKNPPKKVPWNSKWKVSKSPQPKQTVQVSTENREVANRAEIPAAEHSRDRLYQLSRRHSAKLIAARASRQSQGNAMDPTTSTSADETDSRVKPVSRKIVATPPKNLLEKRDKAIRKLYGAGIVNKVSSSSEETDQKGRQEQGTPSKPKRHGFKVSVINNSSISSAYNVFQPKTTGAITDTEGERKGKVPKVNSFSADDNARNIFRSSFMEAFPGNRRNLASEDRKAKANNIQEEGRDFVPPTRRSSFVHRTRKSENGGEPLSEDEVNEENLPGETMYSRILGRARGGPVSVVEIRRAASHDSRITDITEFTGENGFPVRTSVVFPDQKFSRNESRMFENGKDIGNKIVVNKPKPWEGLVPPPPPPLPPQSLIAVKTNSSDESAPVDGINQPKLSVRDRIVAHNRQHFEKGAHSRAMKSKDNNAWALGYTEPGRNVMKSSYVNDKEAYRSFSQLNAKLGSFGTLSSSESTYPQDDSQRDTKDTTSFHLSVKERVAFHNQNPIEPAGATPKSSFQHHLSKGKQRGPKEPVGATSNSNGKIEPMEGKRMDPESTASISGKLNSEPNGLLSNGDSKCLSSEPAVIRTTPSEETDPRSECHRSPMDPESSEGITNSVQQRIASLSRDEDPSQNSSKRCKSLSPKRAPAAIKNSRNTDEIAKLQSEVSDLRLRIKILDKDGNRADLLDLIEAKEEECREKGDQLQKLNEKLDRIEKGLAEIEAERLSLTNRVNELERENERTEKQLRLREAEITSLSKRCLDQAEELKVVTAFRVDKNSMAKEIESLKESMEKKSLEDITTIDCLRNKLNETKRARDELSVQLSTIKRDRDDCSRRLEECLINNQQLSKERSRWEAEKSTLLKDVEHQINELKRNHETELVKLQNDVRMHERENQRLKSHSDENEIKIVDLSKRLMDAKVSAEETLKALESTFESKLESQNRYIDALKVELTETAASLKSAQEMLHESEKTVAERDIIVEDLLEQLSEQERQAAEALRSVRDDFESQAIEALHMAKANFCKLLQEFVAHSELEVKQLREEYEEQISSVQSRLDKITDDSDEKVEESKTLIERLNAQLSDAEGKLKSIFERHEQEMKLSRKHYEDSKAALQQELDLLTAKYNEEIMQKNNEINRLSQANTEERNQLETRIRQLVTEAEKNEERIHSSTSDFEYQLQSLKGNLNEKTKVLELQIKELQDKLEEASAEHLEEVTKQNTEMELLRSRNIAQQEKFSSELKVQENEADFLRSELMRTKAESDSTISRLAEQADSTERKLREAIEEHEREMLIQKEKIAYLESNGVDQKKNLLSKLQETEDSKNELIKRLESELSELKATTTARIESLNAHLAKTKSEHKAQIERLEEEKAKQLSDIMESIQDKEKEIGFQNSEVSALQVEKSALEAQVNESAERLKEKEAVVQNLKSQLSKSQEQLDTKVASFSETVALLNAEHENDIEKLSASHRTEVSMLEAKLIERHMMIECLEKDMEAQMRQLMVTTTRLEELQGDGELVEGLTADIEALELERAALMEDFHEKDMNIAELSAEILKLEIEKEIIAQDSIESKKANAKLLAQEKQHASQLKEVLESSAREQQKFSAVVASLQEDLQQKRDHIVSLQESLRRAELSLEKASDNTKLSDQVLKEKDKIIGELRSEVSKQMIENRGLASKLAVKEDEIRDLEVVEMYDKNEKIRLLQNNVDNLSAQLEFKSEQFNIKTSELENETLELRKKLDQMCKQATDQRDSMQREIDTLQKLCESSKRESDFAKIKLEETERKLKDAKNETESFSTKIHDMEVACKELQDNCRELQLAQEEVNNERNELTLRLEKEMGLVREHEDIRWDLERRCEDLKHEVDSRDETSLELTKKIEGLESSMNEKVLLNEELSRHNKELESFLQTQNQAVDQVRAEVDSLRIKLQARDDQIKELKAEKADQEQSLLDELETERQNLQIVTSELEATQQKLGVLLRENKDIVELEKEREALQDKVRRQEAYLKRKLDKEKMGRATARPSGLHGSPTRRLANPTKRQSTPISPELKTVPTQSTATTSTGGSKLDWELDCLLAD